MKLLSSPSSYRTGYFGPETFQLTGHSAGFVQVCWLFNSWWYLAWHCVVWWFQAALADSFLADLDELSDNEADLIVSDCTILLGFITIGIFHRLGYMLSLWFSLRILIYLFTHLELFAHRLILGPAFFGRTLGKPPFLISNYMLSQLCSFSYVEIWDVYTLRKKMKMMLETWKKILMGN